MKYAAEVPKAKDAPKESEWVVKKEDAPKESEWVVKKPAPKVAADELRQSNAPPANKSSF